MPGKKYASIKWPKMYEGLRKHGFSKTRAAKISNAASNKYHGGRRVGKRR